MSESVRDLYLAMAPLRAPSGSESALAQWLAQRLSALGAEVSSDATGNLAARRGDGGRLLLAGFDEPTFVRVGTGPQGLGLGAFGTGLEPGSLAGRAVRGPGGEMALLRALGKELALDPLGEPAQIGEAYVFDAPRRVAAGDLVGPGAGGRALLSAVLAALQGGVDFTLVCLARAGFAPNGGRRLLAAHARPEGVALDVLEEDDELALGCGPLALARAAQYAAPSRALLRLRAPHGIAVRPQARTLAARLQPAGIEGIGISLVARYRGTDQERISYQDAEGLAELLAEVLGPS